MNTFQLTNSRRRTVRRIYRVHRGKRCPPRRLGLAFRRCRLQWIQSAIGSHAQRKRHLRLPPFGLLSGVVQGRTRALRSKTQPATRHSEGQAHATRQPRSLRPAASRRARAAVRLAAQRESVATTLPVELPHGAALGSRAEAQLPLAEAGQRKVRAAGAPSQLRALVPAALPDTQRRRSPVPAASPLLEPAMAARTPVGSRAAALAQVELRQLAANRAVARGRAVPGAVARRLVVAVKSLPRPAQRS